MRAEQGHLSLQPIEAPVSTIHPAGIVADGQRLVWISDEAQGKSLWLSDEAGVSWRRLMRLERPFPADLQLRRRALLYTLPDGRSAVASLLLPPNYDSSRPYPLILSVYPNQVYTEESAGTQFDPISVYSVDAYALATLGYIVASPSTPPFDGDPSDYEALSYYSGLVEDFAREAIAQRITEPGRIGLLGHSNGGYLGLGVAGRTRLISAIALSSPFPDLVQVDELPAPLFRTDTCAPNRLYGGSIGFVEDPNGPLWRMGAPAHQALERFLRSSPIYQLGPQTPPTLLLQGEFDSRGTADSQRVYTRLNRQNVPVQLAQYWGEGHNLLTAASIRDRVHRIVDWYSLHIASAPGDTANVR